MQVINKILNSNYAFASKIIASHYTLYLKYNRKVLEKTKTYPLTFDKDRKKFIIQSSN